MPVVPLSLILTLSLFPAFPVVREYIKVSFPALVLNIFAVKCCAELWTEEKGS